MHFLNPAVLRGILEEDLTRRESPAPGEFKAATVDPDDVRGTLTAGNWPHGPNEPEAFAAWLADREVAEVPGALLTEEGERIMALALHYYTTRHPGADTLSLASCCGQLVGYATGWPIAYGHTDSTSRALWADIVVCRLIGGIDTPSGPGTHIVPDFAIAGGPVPGVDPAELARMVVNLMGALYFLPLPAGEGCTVRATYNPMGSRQIVTEECEHIGVIREVSDLLSQTRHTFRSKQIERARKLLESVLT